MDEIVLADPIDDVSSVIRKYEDKLDDHQIRSLPFAAHGASKAKLARILKVSTSTVSRWFTNGTYLSALSDMRSELSEWHARELQSIAALAWERAWDILNEDPEPDDKAAMSEQARMARFIIGELKVTPTQTEVTHTVDVPELNVSESSIDLIAKRIRQLERAGESDDIITDAAYVVSQDDVYAVCHPETDYGVMNMNDDKQMQCHVCGMWTDRLSLHIAKAHGKNIPEYREEYGIDQSVAFR